VLLQSAHYLFSDLFFYLLVGFNFSGGKRKKNILLDASTLPTKMIPV
jgi:Fe-S cluster assembly ATPase SufC